jgi:sorbitol-specific phosphotransferase system component IIBC
MTASRQITSGISGPVAMVFDAKGNLYVGNYPNEGSNTVTVYAPGASKPTTTYKRKQQIVGLAISQ